MRTAGTLLGIGLFWLSSVLLYAIVEKIKNNKVALLALFMFMTNPLFYFYSSY